MLGIPVRYFLKHPFTTASDVLADPMQMWLTVQDEYAAKREAERPRCDYVADDQWDRHLHEVLGMRWPCPLASEFWGLWPDVMKELESKGIKPGPESFQWWNDGDAAFVRAAWCLTRHLKPAKVVETGVAHGVTSRFLLEAIRRNGVGHLWSIDLPPVDRFWRQQVGAAVNDSCRERWTYIAGSSRRRLPALLASLGTIDLFIHDSLHSERNVCYELQQVWPVINPNGAFVIDDVDANWGFHTFTKTHAGRWHAVGEAEPLHPDPRRSNKKGYFGIIMK